MNQRIMTGGSYLALAVAAMCMPAAVNAQAQPTGDVAADAAAAAVTGAATAGGGGEEIVVVGSQIRGASTTAALPVSVVSTADIAATGAVSTNDLFRTIPQAGTVAFTGNPSGAGQNAPRGDVASVSLRGMPLGTTLMLLNGRRVVQHPTTQVVDGAPAISFNANAIPVTGIDRVEVLRDGAAALYGADAVAGVINTVLSENLEGGTIDAQYGWAQGTHMKEGTLNGSYGSDFAGGRGHFSVMGTFYARSAELYSDEPYLASNDRRRLVNDPNFSGNTSFDQTEQASNWGEFQVPGYSGVITRDGMPLSTAAGQFTVVPCSNGGNLTQSGVGGVCFRNAQNHNTQDRNARLDTPRTYADTTALPSVRRANAFLFGHYDLTDDIQLFTEASYYWAKTHQLDGTPQIVSAFPITVAADAYWNPLGPVGSPNRLPGLNIPASGLPVTITALTPFEAGPRAVDVTNNQFRLLAGLRGELGGWHWESAAVYSEARVKDVTDAISNTLFQQAVNRTTPDAYNPFNGGDPTNPSGPDISLSQQSTVNSFMVKGVRENKTSLAMWDAKLSNGHLLPIWGGDVGIALGIEARRETYSDDRDPHQDGTITFTDEVTGQLIGTDFAMSSPRADVSGRRTVFSAYGELAIPLVNRDMGIPLVRSIDLQVAGRYEHYSDLGSVAKPKVAGSWDVIDGLRLRGSWSGGFRAPTLEALNIPQSGLTSNGNLDPVRCEADLRAGRIATWGACNQRFTISSMTGGNPNLKAETSTSVSVGIVIEPKFIPAEWGRFTFTADRWWIKMNNVVSSLSPQTLLLLDYLARVQGGSDSAVMRAPVTAADEALFAGTGIAPAGIPLRGDTFYQNLQPLKIGGLDLSFNYASPRTNIGRFNFNVNVSDMIRYLQEPLAQVQQLADAQAAGLINQAIVLSGTTGSGNLVGQDTRPKWRGTATLNWSLDNLSVGAFAQYTDSTLTTTLGIDGARWKMKSQTTANLYVAYAFDKGPLDGTKITVGARNIFNEDPPLVAGGYSGGLYMPYGRYWYASVGYKF